jgi:hypothetical protein
MRSRNRTGRWRPYPRDGINSGRRENSSSPRTPEEPDFTVPHPTFRPGDRVRITHALHRGQTGKIERYFPATENYLVAIDGMPDRIILTDAQMEAV